MKKKALQVTLKVREPSVVELTVGEKVQLDRLVRSPHGYIAERHGDLLETGVTTLAVDQGLYFFKTLSDASLKVVCGGVDTSSGEVDPKDPWPPSLPPPSTPVAAAIGKGDDVGGEAPTFTVESPEKPGRDVR